MENNTPELDWEITHSSKKRKIIDLETLEVYESVHDCARKLGCSAPNVVHNILPRRKVMGKLLDYYDDWLNMTDREKEEYCYKNNIFFLRGKHTAKRSIELIEKYNPKLNNIDTNKDL